MCELINLYKGTKIMQIMVGSASKVETLVVVEPLQEV